MFGKIKEYNAHALEKKERIFSIRCVGRCTGQTILGADFFMGRSARAESVYCSVWVATPYGHTYGKGVAGGAGYCKKSAAFDMACSDANIDIADIRVSGAGMALVKKAALAICEAAGHSYSNILYVEI